MFSIEKLYVDLVTPEGFVAIAYVLNIRAAGVLFSPCALELYSPTGERIVTRANKAHVSWDRAGLELILKLDGGREIRIEHQPLLKNWSPLRDQTITGIDWSVALALGDAKLILADGRELRGRGYADQVTLRRWPRALGLAHLDWGRAHFERGAVIFTRVELEDGRTWEPAISWSIGDREPTLLEGWRLGPSTFESATDRITLEPLVELHAGEAIDTARFPRRLELFATRMLLGASQEQRWLSAARSDRFGEGRAVHESVRFGAPATYKNRRRNFIGSIMFSKS